MSLKEKNRHTDLFGRGRGGGGGGGLTLCPRHTCAQINLVATRQDIEKMAILYLVDS